MPVKQAFDFFKRMQPDASDVPHVIFDKPGSSGFHVATD